MIPAHDQHIPSNFVGIILQLGLAGLLLVFPL
jgi:hypothetical protein